MRHTYKAVIAYDGLAFHGFSRQPGLRTVESVLLEALRPHLPTLAAIQVAGRTDKGVHALGQVVSFHGREHIDPSALRLAIDRAAPLELAALDIQEVPRWFHAQFSATSRVYTYLYSDGGTVDAARVDRMVGELQGTRCFSAFARDTPEGKATVRRMLRARARRILVDREPVIRFDFEANSFLRSQVRVMVSTAIEKSSANAPIDILAQLSTLGDRRQTARPAPADGLYLTNVRYETLRKQSPAGRKK